MCVWGVDMMTAATDHCCERRGDCSLGGCAGKPRVKQMVSALPSVSRVCRLTILCFYY